MTFESSLQNLTTEADERGQDWARSSASLTLSAEDQHVLEEIGRSLAQRAACTPFDPGTNIEDWHAATAHEKRTTDLADAEMAAVHASHLVQQREDDRARLGTNGPPPQLPSWMTMGGIILFAATFAIALYDSAHQQLSDPYLAGLVALIPSVALGVFVVRCLTSPVSPASRRLGFIAGIGLSGATGLLRFSLNPDEPLIAVAITSIELFVVALLHWHGDHLREQHRFWLAGRDERSRADQLLAAARDQHHRTMEWVAELTEKSEAYLREVARRSLLSQKTAEIESAVVNAIVAGAHRGCAANQGLRRGVHPAAFQETLQ